MPLVGAAVLLLMAFVVLVLLHQPAAMWVFLLPGGLLLLLGTRPAVTPVEAIVVDDLGLSDRTMDVGPIPWDQVIGAEVRLIRRFPVVALQLTDEAAWLSRMPERHRKLVALGASELGVPPVFFYAVGLDHSPEEIVAAINQRARGAGRS